MILGIPVVDQHELTKVLLDSLRDTIKSPDLFCAVIIDNASETAYNPEDYADYPFKVDVIRNEENIGYYQPLRQIQEKYSQESGGFPWTELIGLIHNDMVMYEHGWDDRMRDEFEKDVLLSLVGLCGSYEADALGGRGGGTMCYFSGRSVQVGDRQILAQDQAAGLRITDLRPSLILDSLFMMFRATSIPFLVHENEKWEDITLAHFYDRIWPLRLVEAGYHVATMGVECDHLGGMTSTGNERYRADCIKFFGDRGLPFDNPETEMYLIAERRFLGEYREQKHFLPAEIGRDYAVINRSSQYNA